MHDLRGAAGGVVNRVMKQPVFSGPRGVASGGMYGHKRFSADIDQPVKTRSLFA